MSKAPVNVMWFEDLSRGDVALVGGKNSSLGEMVRQLGQEGHQGAVRLRHHGRRLSRLSDRQRPGRPDRRRHRTLAGPQDHPARGRRAGPRDDPCRATARRTSETTSWTAYRELSRRAGTKDLPVAVRSSATAEDLPDASFAGQQETYLNVRGEAALLAACRRCYASLFTDRAITYRQMKGFGHTKVALSIGVQRMVRSDTGGSGVMFSIDTESGFDKIVLINAAWGLGENVVQGAVNPDEYRSTSPSLRRHRPDADRREDAWRERDQDDLRRPATAARRGTCRPRRPNARPGC